MTDINSYVEYFRTVAREHKEINDFSGEMQLVSEMKKIGTDVIARMLNDHHKCEPLAHKAIPGISINSVSYEILWPVFDNDFGVMFSFKLHDCLDLEFISSRWLS